MHLPKQHPIKIQDIQTSPEPSPELHPSVSASLRLCTAPSPGMESTSNRISCKCSHAVCALVSGFFISLNLFAIHHVSVVGSSLSQSNTALYEKTSLFIHSLDGPFPVFGCMNKDTDHCVQVLLGAYAFFSLGCIFRSRKLA